jgi:hypothetical protein
MRNEVYLCQACKDMRFVTRDLPVDHPQFGKAIPCPKCNRGTKESQP